MNNKCSLNILHLPHKLKLVKSGGNWITVALWAGQGYGLAITISHAPKFNYTWFHKWLGIISKHTDHKQIYNALKNTKLQVLTIIILCPCFLLQFLDMERKANPPH